MTIWGSLSVQFVWFFSSVDDVKAGAVYSALMGEEADNVQQNRVPSPLNPFLSVATGVIGDRQYQVQVQPGRMDFVISTDANGDVNSAPSGTIETAAEIQLALEKIELADHSWPPAVRLALVANLIRPTEDHRSATVIFFELTGSPSVPDSSDHIYQVNRRKEMLSGSHTMNRIMRFGVTAMQQFVLEFVVGIGGPGTPVPVTRQSFAAALTLDINTVIDGRLIEASDQITTFRELAGELLRIAETGSTSALMETLQ